MQYDEDEIDERKYFLGSNRESKNNKRINERRKAWRKRTRWGREIKNTIG